MTDLIKAFPAGVAAPTPVIIVEDTGTSGLNLMEQFKLHQERIAAYELDGAVQIRSSNGLAEEWINGQPDGVVRLIILDLNLRGDPSSMLLQLLRNSNGQNIHPALHSQAIIIGWSAANDAPKIFREGGADGFISKNRTLRRFVSDVLQIVHRRIHEQEPWVCLD